MPVYSSWLIADIERIGSRQEAKGAWRRAKGAKGMGQRQMTDDRGQKADDRGQKAGVSRRQKAHGAGRKEQRAWDRGR